MRMYVADSELVAFDAPDGYMNLDISAECPHDPGRHISKIDADAGKYTCTDFTGGAAGSSTEHSIPRHWYSVRLRHVVTTEVHS